MRGSFATAARWNRFYNETAKQAVVAGLPAMRALAPEIQKRWVPAHAEARDFWSEFYEWVKDHPTVGTHYNAAYHYGHGAYYTGEFYREFLRIVRREL